ncbi:hypothetical protein AAC387_Pa01g1835 [Persea americana]
MARAFGDGRLEEHISSEPDVVVKMIDGKTEFMMLACDGLWKDAGMDWIIHLDTDELLHPASAREYSLRQVLLDVPSNVDMVIFPNYESSIERYDIKKPFSERSKGLIRSETKQTAEELQNEDLWLKEEAERMRFQPHTSNRPNWSEASLQMLMDAINVRNVPRVDGQLAMARAFGDERLKEHISSEPDVVMKMMEGKTEFTILACDGLWGCCSCVCIQ